MKINLKSVTKYILLLTFGGYVYVIMELLFRGRSDVSMMFCASVCAIPMVILNNIFSYEMDFLFQSVTCGFACTLIEWITGTLVNQTHEIWDYSGLPLHSPDGMVCLPFTIVWIVISAMSIILMDYIDWQVFNYMPDTPPYYKIFGRVILRLKSYSEGGE